MTDPFVKSAGLMLMLLNPFLMSMYLLDLIQEQDKRTFTRVLIKAGLISFAVFMVFAVAGDAIFRDVLQVRFASFLIFGGIVLLIIGVRYVFQGSQTIRALRGDPQYVAGSIALPFMIGPGTVSASVLAGSNLTVFMAAAAIGGAITISIAVVIWLKWLHDYVRERNERLIERYIEIVGRVTAIVIGTFAVEMISRGVVLWVRQSTEL